jgi:hypothetical protein
MVIGPFPFDMLMRPVKYVEAGGGFVCGGQQAPGAANHLDWVIHNKPPTGDGWSKVFSKTGESRTYPYCGAYGVTAASPSGQPGTPTFIMVGLSLGDNPNNPANMQQVILRSTDGTSWSETRRQSGGFCYVAGWDEKAKKFYVQSVANLQTGTSEFDYEVLASGDGIRWSVASSKHSTGFGGYADPLLMGTGTDLVQDANGQNVPNGGYFGWDGASIKDASLIIAPETLVPYFESAPGIGAGNTIVITKKEIDPETGAVKITRKTKTLPIDQITCTAYAGGVWQAGGFSDAPDNSDGILKIAVSTDRGETWKVEYSVNASKAFCLMGGDAGL